MNAAARLSLLAAILIGMLASTADLASAQAQDPIRRLCILSLNKAMAKAANTQRKDMAKCLRSAQLGKLPAETTLTDCITGDINRKVGKALDKTLATETKFCTITPDFGFAGAEEINAAVVEEEFSLFQDIFGSDFETLAISDLDDSAGASCQDKVAKNYQKIVAAKLKTFDGCKKRLLPGVGAPPADSAAALATCMDDVANDTKGKIGRSVVKVADTIANRCTGVDLLAAFPGECAGAEDFAQCVDTLVSCRACLIINRSDALTTYCDEFDNGVADGSCVDPSRCGNGQTEPGEDCDDGGNEDGDCCAADCSAEPAGQACAAEDIDSNICTDDVCDNNGACSHPGNSEPCDDGLFCNGTDTCSGGSCVSSGDPCSGVDADADCQESCDEAADNCSLPDPDGSACEDDSDGCSIDECSAGICTHTQTGECVYVGPGGSGSACTQGAPCDLATGLAQVGAGFEVRADKGVYSLGSALSNLASDVSLLGGFDSAAGWSRTAGCTATNIVRDASAPDGTPDVDQRIVALQVDGRTGFTVDCLQLSTDNATGANGMSTYAAHVNNSSGYEFSNVTFAPGDAAPGASGTSGSPGADGAMGTIGLAGLADGSSARTGGTGGVGGGAGFGAGGAGTDVGPGTNGSDSTSVRAGGGGGGGGGGGFHGDGGDGGEGGGVNSGANQTDVGSGGAGGNCSTAGGPGTAGGTGAAGTTGVTGPAGPSGSRDTYFLNGSQALSGGDGTGANGGTGGGGGGGQDDPAHPGASPTCLDGVGAGGGGGGGGGEGGTAGTGGFGGGSVYGLYEKASTGTITAPTYLLGTAGAGGTGGMGGTGGLAGVLGGGGAAATGVGAGGNGGNGGAGGTGGTGGTGAPGEAQDNVSVP